MDRFQVQGDEVLGTASVADLNGNEPVRLELINLDFA